MRAAAIVSVNVLDDGDTPLTGAANPEVFRLLARERGHHGTACGSGQVPNSARDMPPCVACDGGVVSGGVCECAEERNYRQVGALCLHRPDPLSENRDIARKFARRGGVLVIFAASCPPAQRGTSKQVEKDNPAPSGARTGKERGADGCYYTTPRPDSGLFFNSRPSRPDVPPEKSPVKLHPLRQRQRLDSRRRRVRRQRRRAQNPSAVRQ